MQIIVTSPAGTESLELADHELQIVSTNATERQLALAKYTEALDADAATAPTARSKSKSPRRARAEAPRDVTPSPWSPAAAHSRPITKARRPHTSAGPRDRPVDFGGAAYGSGVPAVPSVSPSTSPKNFHSHHLFREIHLQKNARVTLGNVQRVNGALILNPGKKEFEDRF